MPQAATVTLNNAAAAAKTFTLITPAAGYGGVAEWNLKEGAVTAAFPKVTSSARPMQGVKGKRVIVKLEFPSTYVETTTGLTKTGPSMEFEYKGTIPDAFPEASKADFLAYAKNLVAQALFNAQLGDGSPMT